MRKSWGIAWRAVGVSPPSCTHLTRRAYAAPLAGFAATGDVTPLIVNPAIMPFNLMHGCLPSERNGEIPERSRRSRPHPRSQSRRPQRRQPTPPGPLTTFQCPAPAASSSTASSSTASSSTMGRLTIIQTIMDDSSQQSWTCHHGN